MSDADAAGVRVVHLVRIGEPVGSLHRFLDSYRSHPAGIEHRLVLLFKGFDDETAIDPYRRAAEDLPHRELRVSDDGFDLTAYRSAAQQLGPGSCCFLNSHSRILADGWLVYLNGALSRPGVGLVAATGSWASQRSLARMHLRLPSAYDRVFGDRAAALEGMRRLERVRDAAREAHSDGSTDDESPPDDSEDDVRGLDRRQPTQVQGIAYWWGILRSLPETLRVMAAFEPFPTPHVRTNAFMVDRDLLMGTSGPSRTSKLGAHALESGPHSLTRQVQGRGLRAVVVDRDGEVYEHGDWPASETFWQGAQRGLLIADNQTDSYQQGDHARRLLLSRYAWGASAAPA